MTETFTELDYRRCGVTGWLTLNRPRRHNALTPNMIWELHRALDLASRDPNLRFLVITGAGSAFCAGADEEYIRHVMAADNGFERLINEFLEPFAEVLARLRSATSPVIAAINGPSVAAGQRIVQACEFTIGPESSTVLAQQVEQLVDELHSRAPGDCLTTQTLVRRRDGTVRS
jgi:enoyl-CoA hydratase/carnithine racemase